MSKKGNNKKQLCYIYEENLLSYNLENLTGDNFEKARKNSLVERIIEEYHQLKQLVLNLKEINEGEEHDEFIISEIKDCFLNINQFLSEIIAKKMQANFFGEWEKAKKEEIAEMVIKLRKQINYKLQMLILEEEKREDNLFIEKLYK